MFEDLLKEIKSELGKFNEELKAAEKIHGDTLANVILAKKRIDDVKSQLSTKKEKVEKSESEIINDAISTEISSIETLLKSFDDFLEKSDYQVNFSDKEKELKQRLLEKISKAVREKKDAIQETITQKNKDLNEAISTLTEEAEEKNRDKEVKSYSTQVNELFRSIKNHEFASKEIVEISNSLEEVKINELNLEELTNLLDLFMNKLSLIKSDGSVDKMSVKKFEQLLNEFDRKCVSLDGFPRNNDGSVDIESAYSQIINLKADYALLKKSAKELSISNFDEEKYCTILNSIIFRYNRLVQDINRHKESSAIDNDSFKLIKFSEIRKRNYLRRNEKDNNERYMDTIRVLCSRKRLEKFKFVLYSDEKLDMLVALGCSMSKKNIAKRASKGIEKRKLINVDDYIEYIKLVSVKQLEGALDSVVSFLRKAKGEGKITEDEFSNNCNLAYDIYLYRKYKKQTSAISDFYLLENKVPIDYVDMSHMVAEKVLSGKEK